MPLINGQKMACEPCIRGHRSTKCTHANERLMVPVRKPGRPLSSCPHPSTRPCACAAVTAAIPRKQKCGCGTPSTTAPEDTLDSDASSSAVTPPSPSKFGSAGFRVQKQGAKAGPSRKQSVDVAGLERMDASQLNILPPYNGMSPQMSDLSLYGPMTMTPGDTSGMFSMFPYTIESHLMHQRQAQAQAQATANGQNDISTNGSSTLGSETPKSCCGGANGVKSRVDFPSGSTHAATASEKTKSSVKSCCSSKSPSTVQNKESTAGIMPPPLPGIPFSPNGIMMSPFPLPMGMPANGMYPFYAQPHIFNYPPQYGSYMQPLQPEQWRQFMAAMTFGQHARRESFGITGPSPMQQTPTTPNGSSWTSHQCSCGDACQCIGCAAHPYNEATQDYVRSAWNTMKEDSPKAHAHANSSGSHLNGSTDGANGANGEHEELTNVTSNGTMTPSKGNPDGTWSPVAAQTPSDAASGISEEQALSASDFFFVSYPFGDSCAGETASCPCGDDCQCIGCAIHNNPDPALATPDEPQS
ncbi:hypothetical protein QQS21_011946 [Conoideocrella luteorostrata]|uniref:Copper-fist domain-containing protein n=1 Tax=Conoideocrella luteorostrata TaxID=1105319 RepID=A0AAJ0FVC2_9HYPO|nr:hypothetical protein QQS21_011946 [Conoideocrella luteorostrata]